MNYREQILDIIGQIMARRNLTPRPVSDETPLYQGGVGLDSLDLAELSVQLELRFGRDPYSDGYFARTLGELLAYYVGHGPGT